MKNKIRSILTEISKNKASTERFGVFEYEGCDSNVEYKNTSCDWGTDDKHPGNKKNHFFIL